jgi:hypothetical protein
VYFYFGIIQRNYLSNDDFYSDSSLVQGLIRVEFFLLTSALTLADGSCWSLVYVSYLVLVLVSGDRTSSIDWVQLSRFHLKTETSRSPKRCVLKFDKNMKMDNAQEHNICTAVLRSETSTTFGLLSMNKCILFIVLNKGSIMIFCYLFSSALLISLKFSFIRVLRFFFYFCLLGIPFASLIRIPLRFSGLERLYCAWKRNKAFWRCNALFRTGIVK